MNKDQVFDLHEQATFVTSKRGKIIDDYNLHSCCNFKDYQRRDDDRCFGQVIRLVLKENRLYSATYRFRTFSYNQRERDCVPVNIRALCEDEQKFPKLNLFRSKNKCQEACVDSRVSNDSGTDERRGPNRGPSLLDRDRNRDSLFSELGLTVNEKQPKPFFPMFAPPLTGRSVFGADPNRAGHDDYFNRLREMHNRGGKKKNRK